MRLKIGFAGIFAAFCDCFGEADLISMIFIAIIGLLLCLVSMSLGIEPDAAVTTIIMRFATLWFAVLLGIIVFGIIKKNNK